VPGQYGLARPRTATSQFLQIHNETRLRSRMRRNIRPAIFAGSTDAAAGYELAPLRLDMLMTTGRSAVALPELPLARRAARHGGLTRLTTAPGAPRPGDVFCASEEGVRGRARSIGDWSRGAPPQPGTKTARPALALAATRPAGRTVGHRTDRSNGRSTATRLPIGMFGHARPSKIRRRSPCGPGELPSDLAGIHAAAPGSGIAMARELDDANLICASRAELGILVFRAEGNPPRCWRRRAARSACGDWLVRESAFPEARFQADRYDIAQPDRA